MSTGTVGLVVGVATALVGTSARAAERTFDLGPETCHLTVRVFRAGMLSSMGHEHLFFPDRWSGRIRVDEALARTAVELRVDATSLHDREPGLSDSDRVKVEQQTRDEVLEADRYPYITFVANQLKVEAASAPPSAGAGGKELRGTLAGTITLHGHARPLEVPFAATLTSDTLVARGSVRLKLHDFGIKPPSAALGTIKVKDELLVGFDVVGRSSSR